MHTEAKADGHCVRPIPKFGGGPSPRAIRAISVMTNDFTPSFELAKLCGETCKYSDALRAHLDSGIFIREIRKSTNSLGHKADVAFWKRGPRWEEVMRDHL